MYKGSCGMWKIHMILSTVVLEALVAMGCSASIDVQIVDDE